MFNAPQGSNFSSKELPAPELARALCRVASFIQEVESYGAELQKYDDWWEHDGLHFHKGAISIHQLFEIVKSPQSLLAAMQGDEEVFIGVAPASQLWYLRFYLSWDDEGFELRGRFDITVPSNLAASFKQRALDSATLEEQDAQAYYKNIRL